MEFVQENQAFRHYNAAGEVDAEITYTLEEEGVIISLASSLSIL